MLFGVAGFDPANASIEHIVPKWQGGADDEANMMLAHLGCNHARNHEDTRRRAQAIEAQRAETAKQGSVHESAAPKGCAK
jgi:5-methylcytosine-specific restriction endonuclease McrA